MSKSGVYLVSATSVGEGKANSPTYTNPDDINLKMASEHQTGQTQNGNPFRGMGKEELLRHSSKPLWVRLRMICVAIILIAWLALIITVVALIFAYPKCKDKDSRSWWQNDVMYRIHVRSFYDSNDDGIGDLKGVHQKLDYVKDMGAGAISLSPIYSMDATKDDLSVKDHKLIDPDFGTLQDLKDLIKAVHDKGMRIVLDFIPNHTSDKHPWFVGSMDASNIQYKNYYVWSSQITNWNSVYGNSSWEMDSTRNEYYLHQFKTGQPDLNIRSDMVVNELKDIMEYWMVTENVDGLFIRNSGYLFEDYDMRNETVSNTAGVTEDKYDYYNHEYTYGLESNRLLMSMFREVADNTSSKFLMADRRGTTTEKIQYYGSFPGSGVHISLNPIGMTPCSGNCIKDYVMDWVNNFSNNKWPNWMTGGEDMSRFASRFPANFSRPFYMLSMLLPGTPIIYYGDELGMTDLQATTEHVTTGLMQWENSTNAGWNCTNDCYNGVNSDFSTINVAAQMNKAGSLYEFIKGLSSLRTEDAFRYGEYHTAVTSNNIFSFVREFDGVTGYLVAINFGDNAETHDYTSSHGTIQSTATAVKTTGSDVGFSVDDDVETESLRLSPLQGIVVSWDFKAKEL